jgi:4-carboxymuconolactone decarboxylase
MRVARLEVLTPSKLSPGQRALYDEIAGGPRAAGPQLFALTDGAGGLTGPFNAMLYAPGVGHALQALGAAVRYRSELSDRVREIAILAVAVAWECDFEIYAHEAIARAAGVTEAEVKSLRMGGELLLTDDLERASLAVVRALLLRADLDDAEYRAARDRLGESGLVELSTLVGYYTMLALQLRVFRVAAPESLPVVPDNS